MQEKAEELRKILFRFNWDKFDSGEDFQDLKDVDKGVIYEKVILADNVIKSITLKISDRIHVP